MSEHLIGGKVIKAGDTVQYTHHDGTVHQAVVKNLEATYRADLETSTVDGNTSRFQSAVPYNEGALGSFQPLPDHVHEHKSPFAKPEDDNLSENNKSVKK